MQGNIFAAVLLVLFSHSSVAIPKFAGSRDDDAVIARIFLSGVEDKNAYVGIADIDTIQLDEKEMVIRIYAGYGDVVHVSGAHPLNLYDIFFDDEEITMRWFPPCPDGPEQPVRAPYAAWRALQLYDIFTIRDSRAYDEYTRGVRDGVTYLVQIRTLTAYREFIVSNPQLHDSIDNARLLAIVDAIATEFATPACYQTP